MLNFFFRRKKSEEPIIPHTKNYQFCLKILSAMNEMQCHYSRFYEDGVIENEIVGMMQYKYAMDGDIKTQVRICLRKLVSRGLITKNNGKFKLIGPMVKVIQNPSGTLCRYKEIRRVNKVFWPDKNTANILNRFYGSVRKYLRKRYFNTGTCCLC